MDFKICYTFYICGIYMKHGDSFTQVSINMVCNNNEYNSFHIKSNS